MPNGITTKSPVFKFSSIEKKTRLSAYSNEKKMLSIGDARLTRSAYGRRKKTTERESIGGGQKKIEESIDIPCV